MVLSHVVNKTKQIKHHLSWGMINETSKICSVLVKRVDEKLMTEERGQI